MGGGWIFLKSLRDTSFNKDLLNEPDPSRWTVPLMCMMAVQVEMRLQEVWGERMEWI